MTVRSKARRQASLAALAAVAGIGAVMLANMSTPAHATVCATEPVEARGEPSRFQYLARAKARAAWRTKVRRTAGLGAPYSNWPSARDTEERCISGDRIVHCIFTGTPCRT